MSVKNLILALLGSLALILAFSVALCVRYAGELFPPIYLTAGAGVITLLISVYIVTRKVSAPLEAMVEGVYKRSTRPLDDGLPPEIKTISEHIYRTSRSLDEHLEQRRALLKNIPDVLIEIDCGGHVIFINDATTALTGWPEEEAVGKEYSGFVPEAWKGKAEEAFMALMKGNAVKGLELPLLLKDGRTNFFEFNSVPVIAEGRVLGCCCMGRDIEERRKMMDELKRARKEAEASSEKLKKTVSDLEEFALLAIRRELKMQELRERFVKLKEEDALKRDFPN